MASGFVEIKSAKEALYQARDVVVLPTDLDVDSINDKLPESSR